MNSETLSSESRNYFVYFRSLDVYMLSSCINLLIIQGFMEFTFKYEKKQCRVTETLGVITVDFFVVVHLK